MSYKLTAYLNSEIDRLKTKLKGDISFACHNDTCCEVNAYKRVLDFMQKTKVEVKK